MRSNTVFAFLAAAFLLGASSQVLAQQSAQTAPAAGAQSSDVDQLAKQLNNPISSLISVPFQYNYARSYNDGGHQNLLNIQPVIPFSISRDWNLISRTIVPVIQQKNVQPGKTQFGLGDVTQSIFFSPKQPTSSGWIWGAGPVA
jgi:hypothetical protein